MKTHLVRLLRALASAAMLVSISPAEGQTVGAAPEPWQPYRQTSPGGAALSPDVSLAAAVVEGAGASPTPGDATLRTAQVPTDGAVMFPQPIFAAPGCEMPCYVDPAAQPFVGGAPMTFADAPVAPPNSPDFWYWRVLPEGVVWQSYWAGVHEPRLGGVAHKLNASTSLLDGSVGGRAALFRYGTEGVGRPQGLELQAEGAAFPRLNLDENWDLDATDFRVGFPLVYGRERWQAKFSYYHLSSHMGDEFAIREMALADRINYSRDALTLALSFFPHPAWRFYAEADWAFYYDVCEPWAFQFGVDVAKPGATGAWGTPFFAVNGHIREEVNYGGNVVAQAGWLWRGNTSQTLRIGLHYYNGKSSQFEFFDQFEEQIGGGLWYDF
jgi:hypothetical protein